MCRSIKPLFNYNPPATKKDVHEASVQFVRKIAGFRSPSKINEKPFNDAIKSIEPILTKLISTLKTNAPTKTR